MVSPVDPVVLAMERNWEMIDAALEGLDESAMARQPTDQCNSVAWILAPDAGDRHVYPHPAPGPDPSLGVGRMA